MVSNGQHIFNGLKVGFVSLVATVFSVSCQHLNEQPSDPKADLLHHNWWNYYERGRNLMIQHNYQQAQSDFAMALGLQRGARFGYPQELWRARTYGLHFVEGYFPHRELGICYLHLGQIDQSIKYLSLSLEQTPSGRAKYYLNLARQKKLMGSHPPKPKILWDGSSRTLWTKDRARTLEGIAEAEGYVANLSLNGRMMFIELAEKATHFRDRINLHSGSNNVQVAVTDLAGQVTFEKVLWLADWAPPAFQVKQIEKRQNAWMLHGFLTDNMALTKASLDGRELVRIADDKRMRSVPVSITVPFDKEAILTADDAAGNRLTLTLSSLALQHDWLATIETTPVQYAVDAATPALPSIASRDRLAPSLTLKGVSPLHVVCDENFFIDGKASDGSGLAHITINGEDLLTAEHRGIKQSYFARPLPLAPGTNEFEILAEDLAGNRSVKQFKVLRNKPECQNDDFRLSVGIPPLLPDGQSGLCKRIQYHLGEEVLRVPIRFRLLERNEGWDYILQEQRLSLSDLSDPSAALRIRKMLPADMLLMGNLIEESEGFTVFVKVVASDTAEILMQTDIYCPQRDRNMDELLWGLVAKVKQHFPMATGTVLSVNDTDVVVELDAKPEVHLGAHFVAVQKGGTLPGDDGVRRVNGQLVDLQVQRVSRDRVWTKAIPSQATSILLKGDRVYAR